MLVKILFIFIPIVAGEWELPEELRPPKELFLRVGGFSPFVGFRETEKDLLVHSVRTWLSEALETKYSPIVFGESDEKSWVCLKILSQLWFQGRSQMFDAIHDGESVFYCQCKHKLYFFEDKLF